MAAERKSLSVVENGTDAILNEDILSELGTTRRSVRQQAIKLQKESEEEEVHQSLAPEDQNKVLPTEQEAPTMESNNKEPGKESFSSKEDDPSSPATPKKRGPGRPRKRKSTAGRSANSSSEGRQQDSSSEKYAGSGVTDSESEDAMVQSSKSPERAPKDETPKGSASSKVETPKAAASKVETPKDTAGKVETPKAAASKVETPKAKASRKVVPERSVRMSPLKNIPAAQREAVSGLHAKSSQSVKQKLELSTKDAPRDQTLSTINLKEDKQTESEDGDKLESSRKRKREESESKDDDKTDEEIEKRELRRRKAKDDGQQSDAPDSEKEEPPKTDSKPDEPPKTDSKQNEPKDSKEDGSKKGDEPGKVETPKRKRGRPRKHPIQPEKVDKEKDDASKDAQTAQVTKETDSEEKSDGAETDKGKIPKAKVNGDDAKAHEAKSTEDKDQVKVNSDQEVKMSENHSENQTEIDDVEQRLLPNTQLEAVNNADDVTKSDKLPGGTDGEADETGEPTDSTSKVATQDSVDDTSTAQIENKTVEEDDVDIKGSVPSEQTETSCVNQETNDSSKDDGIDNNLQLNSQEANVSESTSAEKSIPETGKATENAQTDCSAKASTSAVTENTSNTDDKSEPMDVQSNETTIAAALIPVSGADAAANALPSNSPPAVFPVGTAGSVTPQKAAAEDTERKVRKPKSRPRNSLGRTHFGQTRKRRSVKRNNYDSDSTDVQSECSTDGHVQPAGKKYKRSNSTSTHTSMESEDDRSSHSSVNKGRSTIPALPDALSAQAEPPLCSCKMEWDKPPTSNINVCNAHEVINNKLVECGKSVEGLKVLRPSTRVGFKTLCEEHRHKMAKHQCCPGCGCFCSAGVMMMCTMEEVNHHFHKECIKEIDGTLYCPHCGENASLAKEVTLPSTDILDQLKLVPESVLLNGALKLPRVLLARLTGMSSKALAVYMGEEEDIQTPRARMQAPFARKGEAPFLPIDDVPDDLPSKSITLKSGITISSATLPPGPSRDALETALQFLDTESPKRLRFFPKNLYLSTSQGDLDKVLQMLGDGFDPNYRFPSHNHETALHVAAAKGHLEIIAMLIQAGANIDPVDEDHRTPLHVATENNQVLCMKYLVKNGANPQHLDDDGMSILHAAAKIGSLDAIQFILSLRKVSINVQDDGGWSPVIWAAESKNFPVVAYLLERGADANIRDKEGNTALHWASFAGADELTQLFLGRDCDVQAVNIHGDTPLHIAARENYYAVVNMLLLRNADISIRNKENETPSDCTEPKSDIYLALQVNKRMKYAVSKRAIKTEKIISRDISRGMEVHPIPVVNAVDEEGVPDDFLYVSESCETSRLNIDRNIKHMQGCLCTDDCALETCTCARSSVQCWYSSDGHLLPEFNFHEPPMIFECGRACYCWRNCRNRVVQNGIKTHCVLFRTPKMGWGVRTTQDIKQGTFICEYAGELISDADADIREDDSYLFDLDNREGDVYCIDARFYGNISRFINHLCEPNIVPVRVFIDHHDLRFPRIAFFTSRDVRANEELGFDYGDKFWAIKSKFFTCCCGSRLCKHSQPTPDLFSETNHVGVEI